MPFGLRPCLCQGSNSLGPQVTAPQLSFCLRAGLQQAYSRMLRRLDGLWEAGLETLPLCPLITEDRPLPPSTPRKTSPRSQLVGDSPEQTSRNLSGACSLI